MQDLPHILNWRRISPLITTSGQPSEDELAQIRDTGVTHIVNLGPHSNKGALPDEPGTVEALGMRYVYIPVAFESPTDADFEAFSDALAALEGQKVHVHCIFNARVSAFFFRYAKTSAVISVEEAFDMMDGIWRPGDDWAGFVDLPEAKGRPNRYKGYEY